MKSIRLAIGLCAAFCGSLAYAEELPRRGTLGVALGGSPDGLVVRSTLSPAASEVFEEGDILLSINGVETGGFIGLQTALHQLPSGEAATVQVRRGDEELSFDVVTVPTPKAEIEGASVTYGTATTPGGMRVRTVTMVPQTSALASEAGMPAVFYIQGIPCQSIDQLGGPGHPRGDLYRGLLEAGFIVALADKPGTGDSDGEVCINGGYDAEVEAYTAAARAMADMPNVDPQRLYGIGISMGGIQVAQIAQEVDLAGVITWGTVVQPWADYMITNFRMRDAINTSSDIAASEALLMDTRTVVARALILGQSPEEIERDDPEVYARFQSTYGSIDGFAGRSLKFHYEVDKAPTTLAWSDYDGALLSMHGEYDWVATESDHRLAGALVTRDGKGTAEFEVLPGLDHGWTKHDSLEASFAAAFAGQPDRTFHARAVEWLTQQASQPSGKVTP